MYADNISRIIDHDDWRITSEFYNHLNSMYGPCMFDCFASSNTAKCRKFYSKFWCPGTSGVDAFSFDWSNHNCWLVPPVYLVIRTVYHLEYCKTRGVLIVPMSKSASFWPVLFPSSGLRTSVKQVWEFSDPDNIFGVPPQGVTTVFCDGCFKSSVLAICLDASGKH